MKIYKTDIYKDRWYSTPRYKVMRLVFGYIWVTVAEDFTDRVSAEDYIKEKNTISIIVFK